MRYREVGYEVSTGWFEEVELEYREGRRYREIR